MKAVIAIDAWKGSLSSLEAGEAVERGIRRVYADAEVIIRPLADGGEGTTKALTLGMGGHIEKVLVTGPVGAKVTAEYGIVEASKTAILEMAQAAGITLLRKEERNPLYTTTFGVGEMIADAIKKGCRNFLIGIGGSATNDAGVGMLQALGFSFLDKEGKQVLPGAKGVSEIVSIREDGVLQGLSECNFKIACDVNNPLCGENGCSAIFGPQKGATANEVVLMDGWLSSFARLTKKKYPASDENAAGCGAAGGLGFAFMSYLGGKLTSGVELVLTETRLAEFIRDADVVITGEGRLDGQTIYGKAPIGVAALAKRYDKKVIAFSGCVEKEAEACNSHGIDAFFPVLRNVVSLDEAMDAGAAKENLTATAEQVFRLIRSGI